MSIEYLKGLNTLRFFAAFFVIISHGQISLWKLGAVSEPTQAIFNRGEDGVEFFFTLSGFLITYLLLNEVRKQNTVNLRKFYLRRVFRIWPLYFVIITIGFLLLGIIYPIVFHQTYFEFSILKGLALFLFFLPNIATSFYPTGLMYPLWSIGVEEQYYLFWAPLIKVFKKNILIFIIIFLVVSHVLYSLFYENYFNVGPEWYKFFRSLKFYAMAMGGLFAYIYMNKRSWIESSFFSGKLFQALIWIVIGYHYFFGFSFSWQMWFHFLLSVLYALTIINTISVRALINLEIQPFTYLGIISYGLYMYHMSVDYVLRTICMKSFKKLLSENFLGPLVYQLSLLGLTIIVASLSYKYLESYFLKLKVKYS